MQMEGGVEVKIDIFLIILFLFKGDPSPTGVPPPPYSDFNGVQNIAQHIFGQNNVFLGASVARQQQQQIQQQQPPRIVHQVREINK